MSQFVNFDFREHHVYVVVNAFRLHISMYFISLYEKGGYRVAWSVVKNSTLIRFFEDLKRVN
jgi:hypothetical protein